MPEISKTMTIEMGHRLPNHQGKCQNLHGHSYKIEIFVSGQLIDKGPSEGMVVDFSILKEQACKTIDEDFDHKMCLQYTDPILYKLIPYYQPSVYKALLKEKDYILVTAGKFTNEDLVQKYVLITKPPTAEILALIWRDILVRRFGTTYLSFRVKVWETATSCVEVI